MDRVDLGKTQWEACKQDVVYFFENFVHIQDSILCKTIQWCPWEYLKDLLKTFESNREVIILKARQLGISWLVCGYALWVALFNENARVLMLSKGEDEAWELIDKCRFIYENLPSYLMSEAKHNRRDCLEFVRNKSIIKALPSTKNAGVGYTSTLVIRDELAFHPYAETNFSAVGPTVDAGGQMIDLSTRNIELSDDHFLQRYVKAKNGELSAKAVFLGWKERPVREQGKTLDEWFDNNIRKKYSPYEIEKNYPETEEQALCPVKGLCFFDSNSLNSMRMDCYLPIETDYDGIVKIWGKPDVGVKYCAFLDPSDGSQDPHAAGWMDVSTGRVVAISHGNCKAEKCAEIFDKYCRIYNNAFNEFELNMDVGRRVNEVLTQLNTPNRRITATGKDRENKYGWWTGGNVNSSKNVRNGMLFGLEEAVRNRRIRIHYSEALNEMETMMRLENEAPKVPRGKHDDLVMMLGGLWAISKETPSLTYASVKPGKCVGF